MNLKKIMWHPACEIIFTGCLVFIIVLFSSFLVVGMGGSEKETIQPKPQAEKPDDLQTNLKAVLWKNIWIQGHEYLVIEIPSKINPNGCHYVTVVHNPDCPEHK